MADKAQDIRITKTQRALSMAMLSLLEKNSFQKITVNDICQEAIVSRSTFYTHFEDKYRLLRFCMEELGHKMREDTDHLEPMNRLQASMQAISKHANIYRNIFLADPNRELMAMFRRHFTAVLSDIIKRMEPGDVPTGASPDLTALYCAGGISAMVSWWIEENFPVSVEEIAAGQFALLQSTLQGCLP